MTWVANLVLPSWIDVLWRGRMIRTATEGKQPARYRRLTRMVPVRGWRILLVLRLRGSAHV